ncbi:MAG: pilus assembly PilX N-terminal domain-containing protein [Desulfobacterales bacterium]|jgi:Tfp pilus assembly protein PilX
MRTVLSTLKNQNGSVIVVAMIILALLTILGVSSTNTSTLEVRIATNSQDYQLDFYVADSGWKDGAMWIEEQPVDTRRPINTTGNIVKNFGWEDGHTRINQKSYTGTPPPIDFDVLNPDSAWARNDDIDNDNDGDIDEFDETAFNSRYNIGYYYQVEHLPGRTTKVAGSSGKWRKNFFEITSIAKRGNFDNSTSEILVTTSKILSEGY